VKDFVPVHVEKDDEREFVEAYGILQFPTIVFTDADGEAVATTIHPESPEDALKDLAFARKWLRGEVDLDE
jgi:hypothetical protein